MKRKHPNNRMQNKPNDFGLKYGNHKKKHNEKAEWINNTTRELEGLQEGSKAEMHIEKLEMTLKKSNWKTPGHDGIHGFWFKKFTSIHEMNTCVQDDVENINSTNKGRNLLLTNKPWIIP